MCCDRYNITVALLDTPSAAATGGGAGGGGGGAVVDEVESYAAMRTVDVGFDDEGVPRPLLNGEVVFMAGTLDQVGSVLHRLGS